jgi:hypothetical protein
MYDKYGEDRFAIACEIVSRWVTFETKNKHFTAEWVQTLCNANELDQSDLYKPAAIALCRLFGLKNFDQLYK